MKQLSETEIKEKEVHILEHFDKLCREKKLRYSIAYGTMLGCIRHSGFIPWDDDVDVMMPREDYEKLMSLQYKNGDFEIRHYKYSQDYYYPFAKMVDKSTKIVEPNRCEQNMGIFIDIFPFDYVPHNTDFNQLEDKTKNHGKKLLLFGVSKTNTNTNTNKQSFIRRIKRTTFYYVIKPFRKMLLEKGEKTYYNVDSSNSKLLMNQFFTVNQGQCHSIDDWNDIIRKRFEDIEVSILSNYDSILRGIYGDYMQLPPVEERISPHSIKAWIK